MGRRGLWLAAAVAVFIAAAALWWTRQRPKPVATGPTSASASRPVLPVVREDAVAPRSDGVRLEGLVLAGDEPAANATITLSAWLEEQGVRTVTSDAGGGFVFDGLVPRTYVLAARRDDAVAGPIFLEITASSGPATRRLRPAARLEVTLIAAEGGAPIAGAAVAVGERDLATTDSHGRVSFRGLGNGAHRIRAVADEFAPASREVYVNGPVDMAITLRLERGAGAAGRVTSADGAPAPGVVVSVALSAGGPDLAELTSDEDGRWVFPVLARGAYRFRARRGALTGSSKVVEHDGVTARNDIAIVLPAAAALAGIVVDGAGKPVAAARIDIATDDPWIGRTLWTDARGAFAAEDMPVRRLTVTALRDDLVSDPQELEAPRRDLRLVVTARGSIEGTVVTETGEPLGDAQVFANPEGTPFAWAGAPRDVSNAGGRFRLLGLIAPAYVVRAAPPGAELVRALDAPGVSAHPGDHDVRVVVRRTGRVHGRVVRSDGRVPRPFGVGIDLRPPRSFESDDGSFALDDLGPGVVTLVVSGPSFRRLKVPGVSIAPGSDLDVGTLTVEPGRTLHGKVLGPDGMPVAGASVLVGSELVGDGAALKPRDFLGTVSVVSEGDGSYSAAGLDSTALVAIADHPSVGRSSVAPLPAGDADVTLDLPLHATGSLTGTLTIGARPHAGFVNALAADAHVALSADAGDDGGFRFDRLDPGDYVLVGTIQLQEGFDMSTRTAAAATGASVDIDIPAGPASLTVSLLDERAYAQIFVFSGSPVVATLAGAVRNASHVPGRVTRTRLVGPRAAVRLTGLPEGDATVCAVMMPGDPALQVTMMEERQRGDAFPARCAPVHVAGNLSIRL